MSSCSCSSCEEWRQEQDAHEPLSKYDLSRQYGRRGLISHEERRAKAAEFKIWVEDILEADVTSFGPNQDRAVFGRYIEEFNTCTLPSDKYYNLKGETPISMLNDLTFERQHRRAEIERRERKREEETQVALDLLRKDREAVEAMRRQQAVRTEISFLYKTGKTERARELQASLRVKTPAERSAVPEPDITDNEFD